eukprot:9492294-Pyramimonas_sp.AAC.1
MDARVKVYNGNGTLAWIRKQTDIGREIFCFRHGVTPKPSLHPNQSGSRSYVRTHSVIENESISCLRYA